MKIPIVIAKAKLMKGLFLSEIGNNIITGQQGVTPFIFSQSGDIIEKESKQIIERKNNNL
tara:strand:+ start:177 stop:356 length:180 start_codon:yes stop_codon:yes gene_type:complete